ncbi:hypothetical protein B0H19DRAFT_1138333 [Mycena capillaripes]|nr:hypothetical protein B0H19DRAFT_1138333 [Mycena capillaripes]
MFLVLPFLTVIFSYIVVSAALPMSTLETVEMPRPSSLSSSAKVLASIDVSVPPVGKEASEELATSTLEDSPIPIRACTTCHCGS